MQPWKLRAAVKGDMSVISFTKALTEDMADYVKPSKRKNADLYIIHCGTNDLRQENIPPKQIAENIMNLAISLATKQNEVTISGMCPRGDDLNEKTFEVSEYL